jgi:ribosome-interacting GTPase 1
MGILEKIATVEAEIARTQKNKATEYHLGTLKAKLAKYRSQLLDEGKSKVKDNNVKIFFFFLNISILSGRGWGGV